MWRKDWLITKLVSIQWRNFAAVSSYSGGHVPTVRYHPGLLDSSLVVVLLLSSLKSLTLRLNLWYFIWYLSTREPLSNGFCLLIHFSITFTNEIPSFLAELTLDASPILFKFSKRRAHNFVLFTTSRQPSTPQILWKWSFPLPASPSSEPPLMPDALNFRWVIFIQSWNLHKSDHSQCHNSTTVEIRFASCRKSFVSTQPIELKHEVMLSAYTLPWLNGRV